MTQQIPLSERASAVHSNADALRNDNTHEVTADVAYRRTLLANVVFVGMAGNGTWVLVDAGIPGAKSVICDAAEKRFGTGSRPAAIILTHGHFDHVGAVEELADEWDVPVYAHDLEHPYLDGRSAYPPGDPTVGGGLMAALAGFYPRQPVSLGPRLRALPEDGSLPGMEGWRWLHTPGHSVGHVSLWREADRVLIAGDAFITTAQESAYAVATQAPEMHGPPMYFTIDWKKARESVQTLAGLEPDLVITGHGKPMQGPEMRKALHQLANTFDEVALPKQGIYIEHPVSAEDQSAYHVESSR